MAVNRKVAKMKIAWRNNHSGNARVVYTWRDGHTNASRPMTKGDAKRQARTVGDLGMIVAVALQTRVGGDVRGTIWANDWDRRAWAGDRA